MPLLNGSSKHQNMRTAEALKSLHLCCMDLSEMICGSVLIHTEFWEALVTHLLGTDGNKKQAPTCSTLLGGEHGIAKLALEANAFGL